MKIIPLSLVKSINFWKKQITYAWRESLWQLRQQGYGTLITLLVIAISLTLPTIVYLIWKNVETSAKNWYPTPYITVYLDHSNSIQQDLNLVKQIQALPKIKTVKYLSKEQSLNEFSQWSGISDTTQLLDNNPLPAVIIITPDSQDQTTIEAINTELNKLKLNDIKVNKTLFARLHALSNMIAKLTLSISTIMLLSVCFVIANSVRTTVIAKQKSINIMRLIGATDGFILRPFLYQGALLGGMSALISIFFSECCLLVLNGIASQTAIVFNEHFTLHGINWDEAFFIVLITMLIGWLSAFITTHRYLKKLH